MPGMNLSCCNGDITIAYRYVISTEEKDLPHEEIKKNNKQKEVSYFVILNVFFFNFKSKYWAI